MKIYSTFVICALATLAGCSQQTEATDKLDQTKARVGIAATAYPNTAVANTDFVVGISVVNAGPDTLPSLGKNKTDANKVGMSYHWRQMDEKVAVWDGAFTALKADIKKGGVQTLDLAVKAPAAPGTYILEIDALQNGAFWFAGAGSQTARITIAVK